jgi:hypothetical protein
VGHAASRPRAEAFAATDRGAPRGPGSKEFDYSLHYKDVDLRERPDLYRVGKGEQGVLLVEPYKSELLPLWRFRTPEIARRSAIELYARFLEYKRAGDFVGMDMARKFLQMGYTRSRRYANHASGKKYGEGGGELPIDPDPVKAASALIFKEYWQKAEEDPAYRRLKADHMARFG